MMIRWPGMWLRLSRNLDKEREFYNDALGQVATVLYAGIRRPIFVLRLAHGAQVLVHPIQVGKHCSLPCTYGYAMTTRKAQGSHVLG